jgi:hypothetical protein
VLLYDDDRQAPFAGATTTDPGPHRFRKVHHTPRVSMMVRPVDRGIDAIVRAPRARSSAALDFPPRWHRAAARSPCPRRLVAPTATLVAALSNSLSVQWRKQCWRGLRPLP